MKLRFKIISLSGLRDKVKVTTPPPTEEQNIRFNLFQVMLMREEYSITYYYEGVERDKEPNPHLVLVRWSDYAGETIRVWFMLLSDSERELMLACNSLTEFFSLVEIEGRITKWVSWFTHYSDEKVAELLKEAV